MATANDSSDIMEFICEKDYFGCKKWNKVRMPSSILYPGINCGFVQDIVKQFNRDDPKRKAITTKHSVYSSSVYKHILPWLKVHTVHCESSRRINNFKFMSDQLGYMEKLSTDIDDYIENETVVERLIRYATRDPHTREFPGIYCQGLTYGLLVMGAVSVGSFFKTMYHEDRYFKSMNQLTYEQRKFDQGRLMSMITNGTKAGLRTSLFLARLLAPFYLVVVGLTVAMNHTNPVSYAVGVSTTLLLNRSIQAKDVSFMRTMVMGNIGGVVLGTLVYFQQKSSNQLQDVMNRESIRKKLYYDNPDKYDS